MNAEKDSSPLAERYGAWVVRHRWLVLAVSLAIGMRFASGAARLGFIDEYRVFFGPDNPQLLAFDEVEAIYTKNDNILIVVETPDNDAFSRRTLEVVEEITAEAWKIPFAIRVDSLTNFQHTYAEGEDDLIVEDLVTEANGLSAEQLAQKKVIALFVLPGFRERTFFAPDGRPGVPFPFDHRNATFDSRRGRGHVDFTARWFNSFGPADMGIYHFRGTSRDPRFFPTDLSDGRTIFRPHYDLINQTGLDLQITKGGWLWKLETINRYGQGDRLLAIVGGFEYTFGNIRGLYTKVAKTLDIFATLR